MAPPKNVDNWLERLTIAAKARHTAAVGGSNRNQNQWKQAVLELEKARKPIYIQKGGMNKGQVINIPDKIGGQILQVLINIVNEKEPVLRPEHEGRIHVTIADEPIVRRRVHRDSSYAILAALWLEYQGPGANPQTTVVVQRRAQRFTDHEMSYDYRTRKHGAWKAIDELVRKQLVIRFQQGMYGAEKKYALTLAGAKACYAIFNDMYHPSKGDYELVAPRQGTVNRDGDWSLAGGGVEGHEDQGPVETAFGREFRGVVAPKRPYPANIALEMGDIPSSPVKRRAVTATSTPSAHPPVPVPSTPSSTVPSLEAMRRTRLLRLDPKCMESVRGLMIDAECTEDEAWTIYEQGTKQPPTELENDAELEQALRLSVQSSRPKAAAMNPVDLIDSQEMLDIALAQSLCDCDPPSSHGQSYTMDDDTQGEEEMNYEIALRASLEDQQVVDLCQDSTQPDDLAFQAYSKPLGVVDLTAAQELYSNYVIDLLSDDEYESDTEDAASEPFTSSSCTAASPYDFFPVPQTPDLKIIVDSRERQRNAYFMGFCRNVESAAMRYGGLQCIQKTTHLGDFHFIWDATPDLSAGLAIERKCIDDIISRSASKVEGPHFTQERCLRFAGLPHAYMLIEGDLRSADNIHPRVSGAYQDVEMERLDVINSREELLGYICGVFCRNVGQHAVTVLQTTSPSETAILVTALGAVLQHLSRVSSKQDQVPSYESINAHWCGKRRNKRNEFLCDLLSVGGVSAEMIHRIERRFGDVAALQSAYGQCSDPHVAEMLLSDLSFAGSNFCDAAIALDADPGDGQMCLESRTVHDLLCSDNTHGKSAVPALLPKRSLLVESSEKMSSAVGFDGFAEHIERRVVSAQECAWCQLTVLDRSLGRRSDSLFIILVPGMAIIQALAESFDEAAAASRVSLSERGKTWDLEVVRVALRKTAANFQSDLQCRLASSKGKHPQVVLLMEGLGHGGGRHGACGMLKNALAQTPDQQLRIKGHVVSRKAAEHFTAHMDWFVALIVAAALLDQHWQCFHVTEPKGALPAAEVVAQFVNEMHRLAMLLLSM